MKIYVKGKWYRLVKGKLYITDGEGDRIYPADMPKLASTDKETFEAIVNQVAKYEEDD